MIFALKRIPEGGCILAGEVGLGKTFEAGLVLTELRAEGAAPTSSDSLDRCSPACEP